MSAWGGRWGNRWGGRWGAVGAEDVVLTGTGGSAGIKKRRRLDDLYSPFRFREMAERFRQEALEQQKAAEAAETPSVEAPKPKLTGTEYLASLGITPDLAEITQALRAEIDAEIEAMRLEAQRQIEDDEDAALLLLLS